MKVRGLSVVAAIAAAALVACGTTTGPPRPSGSPAPTVQVQQSSASPSPSPSPSDTGYAWRTDIVGSMFYVGEKASADNGYQTNEEAAWCTDWVACFGGVDKPTRRSTNGYWPAGFTPRENPFYVALPCDEFTDKGHQPDFVKHASQIPWVPKGADGKPVLPDEDSVLKNVWVQIVAGNVTVEAQLEDTGPFEESGDKNNDCGYVFATDDRRPANTWELKAGIDLSPAVMKHLTGNANTGSVVVKWRFVQRPSDGPWTQIVTTSKPAW